MQETYEVDCSSSRPHCPRTQWVSGIKMFRMSQAYGWHVASKPSYMQSGSGINKLCRGDESIANYICLSLELEVQLMLLELGGRLTSAGLEIVGGHHFTASFLLVAMVFQMTLIRIKL
ncbi:hypothetical protein AAG906_002703 [Vitis piasezkii]